MALLTCPDCGGKVSSEAAKYPHCGAPVKNTVATDVKSDNWLIWSTLSTLLCCLPFGIAGMVYASKVDSAWHAGRREEAKYAADKAKMFTLISLSLGLVALYFLCVILLILDQQDIL